MHNSDPGIFLKIWPVSITKNSGSAPGATRKILQRGRKVTKHGTGCNQSRILQLDRLRCSTERPYHTNYMTFLCSLEMVSRLCVSCVMLSVQISLVALLVDNNIMFDCCECVRYWRCASLVCLLFCFVSTLFCANKDVHIMHSLHRLPVRQRVFSRLQTLFVGVSMVHFMSTVLLL